MFYCHTVALVALITASIVSSTSFSGRHRKLDGVEDHRTLSYHRTSSLHRRRHAAKLRPIEDLDEMDLFLNLFADGFQAKAGRGRRQLINRANKDNEGTKNRVQIDSTVLRVQLQSDANTAGTRDGG
uniref:Uncharacterized protein n=1 Tax=Plectus sambesii TaxID=2011161 RepID=A0A914W5G8_9BILA